MMTKCPECLCINPGPNHQCFGLMKELVKYHKSKDQQVKIGTKIWDDGVVKTISRLFTVSQESIENSNQNRREEVYIEFDGWSGDVSLSYIRQNCKILD